MSQSYFAKVANQWDQLRENMFSEGVRDIALERAALHPEAVVADIGTGTGFITQGLAPRTAKVHVVDNSQEMLEVARRNLVAFDHIEYHLAEGADIPLPDGSLDAVLANMYLHHAPDPQAVIAELARLLKPGGRLVITDLDEHSYTWLRDEQSDIWLGFQRDQVQAWYQQAGLVNTLIGDTHQSCSTESQTGLGAISVSILVAVGTKPQPIMQEFVKDHYRQVATAGASCCGSSSIASDCCAPASGVVPLDAIELITGAGSGPAADEANPATLSLGCGNPVGLASLKAGEVVLDIGSGAGADVFPAALRVGSQGKVIGLDMLGEMLARARVTAQAHGYTNVEFRKGDAQSIPLEAASVDVVMSNCVINLVQDKGRAFREAHRVLKPGGRLSVSDIVTNRPFSPALRENPHAWSACISGALSEGEYLALIAQAGFTNITTARSEAWPAEDGTQVCSLSIYAHKPA